MSVTEIKAWMASHVFLTTAIAIVVGVLIVMIAHDAFKNFYLRLVQAASAATLAIGVAALIMGAPVVDVTLLTIGAVCMFTGLSSWYAGVQLHKSEAKTAAELKTLKADMQKQREHAGVRLVVETAQPKADKA